jgi:hypothetical protein
MPEIIGDGRAAQVHTAVHVDHKTLPPRPLELVYAVMAVPSDTAQ